jgi:hypothetical protein
MEYARVSLLKTTVSLPPATAAPDSVSLAREVIGLINVVFARGEQCRPVTKSSHAVSAGVKDLRN